MTVVTQITAYQIRGKVADAVASRYNYPQPRRIRDSANTRLILNNVRNITDN